MAKPGSPVTANLENSVAPKGIEPYETENHLRTLIDAHEIVNNPDKMKAVHKLAGRKHKAVSAIRSISQLRQVSNDKQMAKSQGMGALKDDASTDQDSE
jgi:hypothetical protein